MHIFKLDLLLSKATFELVLEMWWNLCYVLMPLDIYYVKCYLKKTFANVIELMPWEDMYSQ